MEEKKICGNCRYFSQFYIKFGCRFMPINNGSCKLKKVHSNPNIFFKAACNKWEPIEIVLQERRTSIEEAMINISKKLNEIAGVLTDKE